MEWLLLVLLLLPTFAEAQIITTVAGNHSNGFRGDGGPATAASFGWTGGLAVDFNGNLFIADGNNQRIRKVDALTGIITTVAGTGTAGYNGDGIPATAAQLNLPCVVNVDEVGNLYIGDCNNYRIRKIDVITGIITTFAGNGVAGFSGDGGLATSAQINGGYFAFDHLGNMYLADIRRIRKVTRSGIITTIAGNGISGCTGDGGLAVAATVNESLGLCTDGLGNVFLGDSTQCVRKIDISTGVITKVAGKGNDTVTPYLGDDIAATSANMCPYGLASDAFGNLFITDPCNERIEIVNSSGIVRTIAGNGTHGYSGDGAPATNAQLNYPENVALDKCGNLYIADFNNSVIRKVTFPSCNYESVPIFKVKTTTSINLYPNPATSSLTIGYTDKITTVAITNLLGQTVYSPTSTTNSEQVQVDVADLPAGIYLIRINGTEIRKFVKE